MLIRILSTQIILVASPDYLKRRGTPQTPQDLAEHDCLRQTQRGMRPRLMHLVHSQHPHESIDQEVRTVLWANHVDTLLRAASDGMGITSTSVELVATQLAAGELVQVVRPWIAGEVTLFAALPSRKFLPRRTQVFLDYLTEQSRIQVSTALTVCSDC
jgi:DNA-binding transcriptional LysR family regulator